jgi:hypothetical protein
MMGPLLPAPDHPDGGMRKSAAFVKLLFLQCEQEVPSAKRMTQVEK